MTITNNHPEELTTLYEITTKTLGNVQTLILSAHGLIYTILGVSWWLRPSPNRLAGVQWLGGNNIEITETWVGTWWAIGGMLTMIAGISAYEPTTRKLTYLNARQTRKPGWTWKTIMTGLQITTAIFTPLLVSGIFLLSHAIGENPRGDITAASYGVYVLAPMLTTTIIYRARGQLLAHIESIVGRPKGE